MVFAKQSTAIIVTVGPVLNATGVAVTDGVVGDFKISKNGGVPAALDASATLTHRATGHYSLSLTATDVNTVGTVEVIIDDTVNACPIKEIQVVETVIYDALFADAANAFTGAAGSSKITGVVLTDTVTTYTGNTPQTGDTYALANGANGFVATKADTAAILVDTNELQTNFVPLVASGTAQSASSTTVVLAGGPTYEDDALAGMTIYAYGSTQGYWQSREITANSGVGTDTVTVVAWPVTPSGTVTYKIVGTARDQIHRDWTNGGRLDTIIDSILADTGTDGVVVATHTTAAKAEIEAEVNDAIVSHRLDELLNADSDIDGAAPPTVGSVFHELMTKTAGSFTYDQTTDSVEAIRDRGDAAWTTATGFSTHTAADVWASATRTLTAATNITSTGGTTVPQTGDSFARIGAAGAGLTDLGGMSTTMKAQVESEVDDALGGGTGTALTAIPWNASWDAEVQSEVDDALNATAVIPSAATIATAVLTTAMTESYAADGAAPTLAQASFLTMQLLSEKVISGTTLTVKKLDGTTTAATFTLNSATAPTSVTRAT